MNVRLVSALFVGLLMLALVSAAQAWLVFWFSLAGFAGVCLYITRHERRLLRELDDWLGGDGDFR